LVCAGLGILHQGAVVDMELFAIQAAAQLLPLPQHDPFVVVFGVSRIFIGKSNLVVALIAIGYNILLLISLLLDSSVRSFHCSQSDADLIDEEGGNPPWHRLSQER